MPDLHDPRYCSGTSLTRTDKEQDLDCFENMLGEFSDDLYLVMKKLPGWALKELHKAVAERISEAIYSAFEDGKKAKRTRTE